MVVLLYDNALFVPKILFISLNPSGISCEIFGKEWFILQGLGVSVTNEFCGSKGLTEGDDLFLWYCGLTKGVLILFPAGTIVRDPHHHESLTRRKQDLNLCRT